MQVTGCQAIKNKHCGRGEEQSSRSRRYNGTRSWEWPWGQVSISLQFQGRVHIRSGSEHWDSILRHKYWVKHEMEAVDLPNPRAVNSWRKTITKVYPITQTNVYRSNWRLITPTIARWEMVQGVECTLTMIAGIMRLLLTDRGLDCLIYPSQGQRTTYQRKLVLRSS